MLISLENEFVLESLSFAENLDLITALRSGVLAGAALDVFAIEPLTQEAAEKFKGLKNLLLTPHIAGISKEANIRVSALTVSNVLQELKPPDD